MILLGLTGMALIAAGLFPTDPGGRRDTWNGMLHAVAGLALLFFTCVTPIAVGALPTQGKFPLAWFRVYSFVTGAALAALLLLTPNGLLPGLIEFHRKLLGELFSVWYKYYGVHQRLFMLLYFAWLGVLVQLRD